MGFDDSRITNIERKTFIIELKMNYISNGRKPQKEELLYGDDL